MNGQPAMRPRAGRTNRRLAVGLAVLLFLVAGCKTAAGSADGLSSLPNVQTIQLLTPSDNAGLKPHFVWQAIEGADSYFLAVFDAGGRPYWSWSGTAAEVYLGGINRPLSDGAGPALVEEMSWRVYAFDAGGMLIAVSNRQAIAP
jgi:hypothetical protein